MLRTFIHPGSFLQAQSRGCTSATPPGLVPPRTSTCARTSVVASVSAPSLSRERVRVMVRVRLESWPLYLTVPASAVTSSSTHACPSPCPSLPDAEPQHSGGRRYRERRGMPSIQLYSISAVTALHSKAAELASHACVPAVYAPRAQAL